MNAVPALTLRSGPPRRVAAIALSALALAFLGTKLVAVVHSGQAGSKLPGVVVAGSLCVAMLYVLFVNLLRREALTIARDGAGAAPGGIVLAEGDIVRVELLATPAYGAHAWGLYNLGLSPGLLVLQTRDGGTVRFGAGWSEEEALAQAARIERFRASALADA